MKNSRQFTSGWYNFHKNKFKISSKNLMIFLLLVGNRLKQSLKFCLQKPIKLKR